MSLLAPATTVAACRRPGWRETRSIAPEMETAATTRPEGPRTGAETEATPNSRSLTLWAQPRRRTPDKVVAVNFAPWSPTVQTVRLLPCEQDLSGGTGEHGKAGSDGDRVAQPHRALGG